MKQMKYKPRREIEVLEIGNYKNYKYFIISLGTHPTAYIEIPKDNIYFNKNYDDIDINVHGGLTYSRHGLLEYKDSWFIGWDYSHCNDYNGFELNYPNVFKDHKSKKWTTEEILENVKSAIEQLEVLNENIN